MILSSPYCIRNRYFSKFDPIFSNKQTWYLLTLFLHQPDRTELEYPSKPNTLPDLRLVDIFSLVFLLVEIFSSPYNQQSRLCPPPPPPLVWGLTFFFSLPVLRYQRKRVGRNFPKNFSVPIQ